MLADQAYRLPLVWSIVLQLDNTEHLPGAEIFGKVCPLPVARQRVQLAGAGE